jgi:hypothetical protein
MNQLANPVTKTLQDRWRNRLADAQSQYSQHPTVQTKLEFVRLLEVFADLILRGKAPRE